MKDLPSSSNARNLPGVVLQAGRVRADVSQAREEHVRRLPDSRHRSRNVPAGPHWRAADRGVPRGGPRRVPSGVSRRTSTNTRSCRSTFSRARPKRASRSNEACQAEAIAQSWTASRGAVHADCASGSFCISAVGRVEWSLGWRPARRVVLRRSPRGTTFDVATHGVGSRAASVYFSFAFRAASLAARI